MEYKKIKKEEDSLTTYGRRYGKTEKGIIGECNIYKQTLTKPNAKAFRVLKWNFASFMD